MSRLLICLLPPLFAVLAGCDQIAVLDGSKAREAEGVAIGSACRQAGRAIEDCFTMNPDAPKASVFAGWKEMNDYMVANKLESVKPEVPRADKEAKGEDKGKGKEEAKREEGHAAAGEKAGAAAEVASSAPGVPVVPTAVDIPGLNTGTAVPPPTAIANAPLPKTAPAAASAAPAAPAPNSIALGGQNIPLAVPGTPAAAAPSAPAAAGAAPAHH